MAEPLRERWAPEGAPAPLAAPALWVHGLRAGYRSVVALEDVTFQVPRGSLAALIGPNGAGKSTVFHVLLGLLRPWAGTIEVEGRPLAARRRAFGYLPQTGRYDLEFPVTVRDVVVMGRYARLGPGRWPGARDWQVVERCLAEVGMTDLADRSFSELSGGQRQRVLLARALAQEAPVLLLDEPVSNVDVLSQETVLALLERLTREGTTVLVATHDLHAVSLRFDWVVCLNRRVIAEGPAARVLTRESLDATFGSQLGLVEIGGKLYGLDTGTHH